MIRSRKGSFAHQQATKRLAGARVPVPRFAGLGRSSADLCPEAARVGTWAGLRALSVLIESEASQYRATAEAERNERQMPSGEGDDGHDVDKDAPPDQLLSLSSLHLHLALRVDCVLHPSTRLSSFNSSSAARRSLLPLRRSQLSSPSVSCSLFASRTTRQTSSQAF